MIYLRFIIVMTVLCLCNGNAMAWPNITIDGSISSASSLQHIGFNNSSRTYGFGTGVNLDWNNSARITKAVVRADLNYYRWSEHSEFVSGSYSVVPLFLGLRFYFPLKFFIDGGFELNYGTWQSKYTGPLYGNLSPGSDNTHRVTVLRFAPGAGFEYLLSGKTSIGMLARYHTWWNGPSYSTLGLFVGYHY